MACWQNLMVKEVYPWENVHTCQEKLGYSENIPIPQVIYCF